ncbi:MAG: M24 family metallopeptidase, partial [Opitutales bacterium]|nr:M24 family metallopeptidase [Opitutales bacterium]
KFVSGFFEKSGYKTEIANGKWRGFFHSTGHGIGLDIHEEPRLGLSKNVLRENEVVTVEPGLYYEGLGACRIEDNCRVLKNSRELLSNFDYDWVVK